MKREMKKVTAVLLICMFSVINVFTCIAGQTNAMYYTMWANSSNVMVHAHSLDSSKCASIKYTVTFDAIIDIRGSQTTGTMSFEDEVTDVSSLHKYITVADFNQQLSPAAHKYIISIKDDVTIDYEVTFADGTVENYSVSQTLN